VIEMVQGNIVDPYIQGDALKLSPFVVLASLVFWGWLFGLVGALIAPSFTAALALLAERIHREPDGQAPCATGSG
jgi:predicted PurR-regulated permease PerM